jgi:hypothetical protein
MFGAPEGFANNVVSIESKQSFAGNTPVESDLRSYHVRSSVKSSRGRAVLTDSISREELKAHLELVEMKSNLRASVLESKIDRLIDSERHRSEAIDSRFEILSNIIENLREESRSQSRESLSDNRNTRWVLWGFIITVLISFIGTILTIISTGESIKSNSLAQSGNIISAIQTGVSLGGGFVEGNGVKASRPAEGTEEQTSTAVTPKPKD